MNYEPDVDYYLGNDTDFLSHENPEIEDILPVLDDLFIKTEVALNDLVGATSRNNLSTSLKEVTEVYLDVAHNREKYNTIVGNLRKVV